MNKRFKMKNKNKIKIINASMINSDDEIVFIHDCDGHMFTSLDKIQYLSRKKDELKLFDEISPRNSGAYCPFYERWLELYKNKDDREKYYKSKRKYYSLVRVINGDEVSDLCLFEMSVSMKCDITHLHNFSCKINKIRNSSGTFIYVIKKTGTGRKFQQAKYKLIDYITPNKKGENELLKMFYDFERMLDA